MVFFPEDQFGFLVCVLRKYGTSERGGGTNKTEKNCVESSNFLKEM
jgi:hypothetical protein